MFAKQTAGTDRGARRKTHCDQCWIFLLDGPVGRTGGTGTLHPAAVIVAGTTLSLFGGTLKALEQAGIPVFGIGVTGGQAYGLTAVSGGQNDDILGGQLMADWVLVHKGIHANVVFFGAPELSFSPYMWTRLLRAAEEDLSDLQGESFQSCPCSRTDPRRPTPS